MSVETLNQSQTIIDQNSLSYQNSSMTLPTSIDNNKSITNQSSMISNNDQGQNLAITKRNNDNISTKELCINKNNFNYNQGNDEKKSLYYNNVNNNYNCNNLSINTSMKNEKLYKQKITKYNNRNENTLLGYDSNNNKSIIPKNNDNNNNKTKPNNSVTNLKKNKNNNYLSNIKIDQYSENEKKNLNIDSYLDSNLNIKESLKNNNGDDNIDKDNLEYNDYYDFYKTSRKDNMIRNCSEESLSVYLKI